MGDIADMMLDGTMCATCGEFIHEGEADGIPRYCCDQCDPHFQEKPKFESPLFVIRNHQDIADLVAHLAEHPHDAIEWAEDRQKNPLCRIGRRTAGQRHPARVATVCVRKFNMLEETKRAIEQRGTK